MDTIVLKFGGSSVADNEKLKLVANELSSSIQDREMDVLLSSGEQISSAKLSILLNELGYKSISLTGWQARYLYK